MADQIKNYFVVTAAGLNLIANLAAGEQLTITKCKVGDGTIGDTTDPRSLTDLISPIAQAVNTAPTATDNRVNFEVEYRNSLSMPTYWIADGYYDTTTGHLNAGFALKEYGVYANDPDDNEVLIFYATIAAYPEAIFPYTEGNIQVKRYPVQLEFINDGMGVATEYDAGAFVTHDDLTNAVGGMQEDINTLKEDVNVIKTPFFGICDTAANVTAKIVDINPFLLQEGTRVVAFFTNGNTADIPTLNVAGTGAKQIWFRENPVDTTAIIPGATLMLNHHDGHWDVTGDLNLQSLEVMSVSEGEAGVETTPRSISAFNLKQIGDAMYPGYATLVAAVQALQTMVNELQLIVSQKLSDYKPDYEEKVTISSATSVIIIQGRFDTNRIYI
jgi:hypothetical protein